MPIAAVSIRVLLWDVMSANRLATYVYRVTHIANRMTIRIHIEQTEIQVQGFISKVGDLQQLFACILIMVIVV